MENKSVFVFGTRGEAVTPVDISTWEEFWKDPTYKHNKFFKQMEQMEFYR